MADVQMVGVQLVTREITVKKVKSIIKKEKKVYLPNPSANGSMGIKFFPSQTSFYAKAKRLV